MLQELVFDFMLLFFLFFSSRYIFTIVSYLIGVFIFATIVGQVGNVITNRNANRLEFERLLDGAKTYMRHHKVSCDDIRYLQKLNKCILGARWHETQSFALV